MSHEIYQTVIGYTLVKSTIVKVERVLSVALMTQVKIGTHSVHVGSLEPSEKSASEWHI